MRKRNEGFLGVPFIGQGNSRSAVGVHFGIAAKTESGGVTEKDKSWFGCRRIRG